MLGSLGLPTFKEKKKKKLERNYVLFILRMAGVTGITEITEIPTEITMEITMEGRGGGRYDTLGWIRIGYGCVRGRLLGKGEIS